MFFSHFAKAVFRGDEAAMFFSHVNVAIMLAPFLCGSQT
jgi:hypothetical protein